MKIDNARELSEEITIITQINICTHLRYYKIIRHLLTVLLPKVVSQMNLVILSMDCSFHLFRFCSSTSSLFNVFQKINLNFHFNFHVLYMLR